MSDQLFVSFSDIYTLKLQNVVAAPLKPTFYGRHVNDMLNRRKSNTSKILFQELNNYYLEITLTI